MIDGTTGGIPGERFGHLPASDSGISPKGAKLEVRDS